MLKILALFSLVLSTQVSAHHETLTYGDYNQFFELGEVTFERSAGSLNGRVSDYHVVVTNHYNSDICLVPTLQLIKNGRNEFLEESFILPPNSTVDLGSYGAEKFGKSWHVKWDYFISQNLEYCAL
jgi:hypothetical protein